MARGASRPAPVLTALGLALAALPGCARTQDACSPLPVEVSDYLQSHKGWSIVGLEDLQADDRELWRRYHAGACPGLAKVKLFSRDETSYAVALLSQAAGGRAEKLVLLRMGHPVEETLVEPAPVANPIVVWAAAPGVYSRPEGSESAGTRTIANDSIMYEQMETGSLQIFADQGKLVRITASE